MPFTVSHLGPGLFLQAIGYKIFNFWALILGSITADIEALVLFLSNYFSGCYNCSDHGFFHSILGAIVGSLILAILILPFRRILEKISLKFEIKQSFSFPVLFFSALIAWLIHIFIDSLTHYDVYLFWPIKENPILIGPQIYWPLNWILIIIGVISSIFIYQKYKKNHARH